MLQKIVKQEQNYKFKIPKRRGKIWEEQIKLEIGQSRINEEMEKKQNLLLAYSYSRPRFEKTIRATSASQSTDNSYAFLSKPFLRLQKVTCRLVVFSILLISIFPLPVFLSGETDDMDWFGKAMAGS